jgi:hypothetical protein
MDRISDLPDEALVDKRFLQRLKTKSNLIIPLAVGGSSLGLLGFGSIRKERTWPMSWFKGLNWWVKYLQMH